MSISMSLISCLLRVSIYLSICEELSQKCDVSSEDVLEEKK